jgi:5-methylcytosine-specific restriction endonuclease McrA
LANNQPTCSRECKQVLKRQYDKARYELRREETIARAKEWYETNTTKKQQYDVAYREKNKEIIAARKKLDAQARYLADPETAKVNGLVSSHNRRAKIVNNGIYKVTSADIKKLRAMPCFYCGSKKLIEIDHVMPLSRGGQHSIGNLLPACRDCNRAKHHKTIMEWRLGKIINYNKIIKL